MKKSPLSMSKLFLTSILVASVGGISLPVSADPAAVSGAIKPANVLLLASTDFKGIHPNKPHIAYEHHGTPVQFEDGGDVLLKGKPPYSRHSAKQHALEKVHFARFDKTAESGDQQKSIYRGTPGQRPPYKRN